MESCGDGRGWEFGLLVTSWSHLITPNVTQQDAPAPLFYRLCEKQLANLHARTLDLSSFVHTRALRVATLPRILYLTSNQLPCCPPPPALPLPCTAPQLCTLTDKAASVCCAVLGMLGGVLVCMHLYRTVRGGGGDGAWEWEVRYK